MLEKLLFSLKILQKVSNEERIKQGLNTLGRGYWEAYRMNPFNPLSYVIILLAFISSLICFGIIGTFQELYNPFKWN